MHVHRLPAVMVFFQAYMSCFSRYHKLHFFSFYFILLIISVVGLFGLADVALQCFFFFFTVKKKLDGPPDISRTSSLVDDMDFASEYIPLPIVTDASQWVHSASCFILHEFKSFIHQCTYPPGSTRWM